MDDLKGDPYLTLAARWAKCLERPFPKIREGWGTDLRQIRAEERDIVLATAATTIVLLTGLVVLALDVRWFHIGDAVVQVAMPFMGTAGMWTVVYEIDSHWQAAGRGPWLVSVHRELWPLIAGAAAMAIFVLLDQPVTTNWS